MNAAFYSARAWAIRDAETRERLSYRYFSRRDLPPLAQFEHTGRVVEVYQTSMQRPVACRGK